MNRVLVNAIALPVALVILIFIGYGLTKGESVKLPEPEKKQGLGIHLFMATDETSRKLGLMKFPEGLDDTHGVMLVFPKDGKQCVTNKVPYAYAIAYMNAQGQVLSAEDVPAGDRTLHCGKGRMIMETSVTWMHQLLLRKK